MNNCGPLPQVTSLCEPVRFIFDGLFGNQHIRHCFRDSINTPRDVLLAIQIIHVAMFTYKRKSEFNQENFM